MLQKISQIENNKIICLDFDDCIIPWDYQKIFTSFDNEKLFEEVEKNSKIIREFCEKNGFKIVITSSWSVVLDDELSLKDIFDDIHKGILKIILKELGHLIISKDPYNNRLKTILKLLLNDNIVIVIDDMDLSNFSHDNYYFLHIVNGEKLKDRLNEIEKKLRDKGLL